jgi:lysophospholipase L1-like esterase
MNIFKLQNFLIIGILLSPSIALSSQVVVAWGDSLTAGVGGEAWTKQFASLSGVTTLNRGVGGDTSTQIANRFFAEPTLFNDFSVIWAGRNNYTDPSTVKYDIAAMVSSLSTQNYLILGVINGNYGGYESIGGTGYSLITGINSDLAATYGSRFIDIRATLVSSFNPFSSQDLSDIARDIVPSSLRSDSIHLNSAGYSIVANTVYAAYSPVPLPSASWLFASGLALLQFTRRKKQKS